MPKTLYLTRHAKSSWKDASLTDEERPLNKRGRRSAPDMGERLAAENHRPDLIISSPANRALSTARIIANKLDYDQADIVIDERMYFSGTESMLNLLEEQDDRLESIMIVGHNPAMTSLMNTLCDTPVYNMPTCAIAVIGCNAESWSELRSADRSLLAYDFPKGSSGFAY